MTVSDSYADILAAVACQAVSRVRDRDPEGFDEWLMSHAGPDPLLWLRQLMPVVAAAVPEECPHCEKGLKWSQLTAWAREPAEPGVDEVAVERAVLGDRAGPLGKADRRAAVLRLHRYGVYSREIARMVGCSHRTVTRDLAVMAKPCGSCGRGPLVRKKIDEGTEPSG